MSAVQRLLPGPSGARRLRWRVILPIAVAALLAGWLWPGAPATDVAAARVDSEPAPTARAASRSPLQRIVGTPLFDLFGAHAWQRPPPPESTPPPPVPVEPGPPPLPFSYFGQYARSPTDTVFFLAVGDRVYDVRTGDIIDNTYRLDGLEAGQLEFTYLPLESRQSLAVGNSP
ncbi:MAG: hypothetical protein U1F30_07300 [Steroidobacteraceae bacterium]